MTSVAKREKLHQYIDRASNGDIDGLLHYIEGTMQPEGYDKWEDPEFIAEMERRVKNLENGSDKGATWDEVKERARQAARSRK